MSGFDRIGVIARPCDDATADAVRRVAALAAEQGRTPAPDPEAARALDRGDGLALPELSRQIDLGVVVGGDGTLLTAARELAPRGVPVCGVNRGRLGFLADIHPEQIGAALGAILEGRGETDPRSVLACAVARGGETLLAGDAFNDVVVHSYRDLHMIELQIRIDGRPLSALRADGLIISTPTGSTAYALSGGGPILQPSLPVVVLVPICPHMLNSRPIAVSLDAAIELEVIGRAESRGLVSLDGHENRELAVGDVIRIRRQDYPLTLIQPAGHDHFELLRRKLSWNL